MKNSKITTIVLVTIIVILTILCALFATDTIDLKRDNNNIIKNNDNTQEEVNKENNENDNNQYSETNNNVVSNSNDSEEHYSNSSSEATSNNSQLIDKVFISQDNTGYYLTLWNDGTYKYVNDGSTSGTYGKYYLDNEKLVLYYLFSIDSNNKNKINVTEGTKTLKVVSQSQITDGNITFTSANQPAREGGQNFYTELYNLLKYYHDEQMKDL